VLDDEGRNGCMPSGANNTELDKVRELQVKLYLAAKRSPGRRFHALWDRIHRRDVLERAWLKVRENRGAAGVDRTTIAEIEQRGVEAFLDDLAAELRRERYRRSRSARLDRDTADAASLAPRAHTAEVDAAAADREAATGRASRSCACSALGTGEFAPGLPADRW
jgi:hypothetical protein